MELEDTLRLLREQLKTADPETRAKVKQEIEDILEQQEAAKHSCEQKCPQEKPKKGKYVNDPRFTAIENDYIASKKYDTKKFKPFIYKREDPDYREGNCLETLGTNFKPKPLSDTLDNEAFLIQQMKQAKKQRKIEQTRQTELEKEESRRILQELKRDEKLRREQEAKAKQQLRADLDRQLMTRSCIETE